MSKTKLETKKKEKEAEEFVRVTIPFPKELYDKLKTLSDKDERSFTGQVIYLLKTSVKE